MSHYHSPRNIILRIAFITIAFSIGLACLALTMHDYNYAHTFLTTSSPAINEATLTIVALTGIACIIYGLIMLRTFILNMLERREEPRLHEKSGFGNEYLGRE